MPKAVLIRVKGRVQGVGFRPFVFQLAEKYQLTGTVQNNMDGVRILAEGEDASLQKMIEALKHNAPRLSRIDSLEIEKVTYQGFQSFEIVPSERSGASSLVIPVDANVCNECLEEMKDSSSFRYQYPFINCTQCGPRYTIIEELPYDRPFTVMKEFEMCDQCKKEYEDPTNRRHHAQPIACPTCGPQVKLYAMNGKEIASQNEVFSMVKMLLQDGKIIAIKGIGGYHLACDATNQKAIATLRARKKRPQKPLAIMAKNLEGVQQICSVQDIEIEQLTSTAAPIVVLRKKIPFQLPNEIALGIGTIGVMLPYTPLHHLLFDNSSLLFLVMTSANPSGLPMLHKDDQAFQYLEDIADYVLSANREILHPIDDSVVQVVDGRPTFLRRARGYVPDPIFTTQPVHGVLALGSQQKNTFAIGRYGEIFVGPHIGDMDHYSMIDHYNQELQHLLKWLGPFEHPVVAMDKHPGYAVRELSRAIDSSLIIEVQHHHAHHVSCMEDNNLRESCFGIILDGTGYGEDGNIWGFEILYGNAENYKRLAHLQYSPLPGSEKAIREPWRNAVGMLIHSLGIEGKNYAHQLFSDKAYEIEIIHNMIEKKINSPLAGTCGRLFDSVSAILGICTTSTYDGEAAIKISERVPMDAVSKGLAYPFTLKRTSDLIDIDFSLCLKAIVCDYLSNRNSDEIIQAFHETVMKACIDCLVLLSQENSELNRNVVLSGGSFHNPFLTREMKRLLEMKGFNVFTHRNVPCNDGGLSLGQLMIAASQRNA